MRGSLDVEAIHQVADHLQAAAAQRRAFRLFLPDSEVADAQFKFGVIERRLDLDQLTLGLVGMLNRIGACL